VDGGWCWQEGHGGTRTVALFGGQATIQDAAPGDYVWVCRRGGMAFVCFGVDAALTMQHSRPLPVHAALRCRAVWCGVCGGKAGAQREHRQHAQGVGFGHRHRDCDLDLHLTLKWCSVLIACNDAVETTQPAARVRLFSHEIYASRRKRASFSYGLLSLKAPQ
jgi:hypothetical protein